MGSADMGVPVNYILLHDFLMGNLAPVVDHAHQEQQPPKGHAIVFAVVMDR
jgi:hypothetical protein